MAERRPLVLVNGRRRELPPGDTLPGATATLFRPPPPVSTFDSSIVQTNTSESGSDVVNGKMIWQPIMYSRAARVDRLGMASISANGGGNARFTIYADNGSFYPGALLQDASTVPFGSFSEPSVVTNYLLAANVLHWIGFLSTFAGSAPSIRFAPSGASLARLVGAPYLTAGDTVNNNFVIGYESASGAYTMAPANAPAGLTVLKNNNGGLPILNIRFAAA